jgi:hypothetical protein
VRLARALLVPPKVHAAFAARTVGETPASLRGVILAAIHGLHMSGVNARPVLARGSAEAEVRIMARMISDLVLGEGPSVLNLPCHNVRASDYSVLPEASVAVRNGSAGPRPALIRAAPGVLGVKALLHSGLELEVGRARLPLADVVPLAETLGNVRSAALVQSAGLGYLHSRELATTPKPCVVHLAPSATVGILRAFIFYAGSRHGASVSRARVGAVL